MPPRSLLLNVSITAKGIDEGAKVQAAESVKQVKVEVGEIQIGGEAKEGRERIDSAASIQTSPLHGIVTSVTDENTITISTTSSSSCAISTPLDSPVAMSPDAVDHLLHCASCGADSSSLRRCSRCKQQRYCSRNCQKAHWPTHKQTCNPPDSRYSANVEIVSAASTPISSSFVSPAQSPSAEMNMIGDLIDHRSPSEGSSPSVFSPPVSREWTPERF
ncbi:hypothetical protein B0J11DRAFT_508408 [Dendryphion nanum]|uniref:MYND-type domain-containing protein n=1 Tax=Dendryphion nanum TaxID=256645 RepID=A0A9P9DI61_9PLEO|nr:hypothetical protein B0J11DRAFT_508408 [Dendryphion nanum]